ncbi:MAG: hypothetical protein M1828_001216 [Chrysothrix sp. TS-e1954]|nr:MAG: hypothetical protein M1828_001216 [Chrysothrix sp. TS-e1954]
MVFEPISGTIGASAAFVAFFTAIHDLCNAYKLTSSFGMDYQRVGMRLEYMWLMFDQLGKTRLSSLDRDVDVMNPEIERSIQRQLAHVKLLFQACHDLMKKYHDQGNDLRSRSMGWSRLDNIVAAPENDQEGPGEGRATNPQARTGWRRISYIRNRLRQYFSSKGRSGNRDSASANVEMNDFGMQNPTLLSQRATNEERSRIMATSADLQHRTAFIRRFRWADQHRETLLQNSKELWEDYLQLKEMLKVRRTVHELLSDEDNPSQESDWPGLKQLQSTLWTAHEALKQVNGAQNSPVHGLSVQSTTDHRFFRPGVEQDWKYLHKESVIVNLMDYNRSDRKGQNMQLLILDCLDCLQYRGADDLVTKSQCLETIERPSTVDAGTTANPIELWGHFRGPKASESNAYYAKQGCDIHALLCDTANQWKFCGSLDTVIGSGSLAQQLSPRQTTELAIILVHAHLFFSQLRPDCHEPRPCDVVFYRLADQEIEDICSGPDPLALSPWLDIGFGKKPAKRVRGLGSGIQLPSCGPYIELALLLFQLGAASILDYGSGPRDEQLPALERQMRDGLDRGKVYGRVGSAMNDVVRALLERPKTTHEDPEMARSEQARFIKSVISKLTRSDIELAGIPPQAMVRSA